MMGQEEAISRPRRPEKVSEDLIEPLQGFTGQDRRMDIDIEITLCINLIVRE